jgi:hypothetical protein
MLVKWSFIVLSILAVAGVVALVLGGFVRGAHAGPPTVDSPAVASLAAWISTLKAW